MTAQKSGLITQQEKLAVVQVRHGLERDLITVLIPFMRMIVWQILRISQVMDICTIGMLQRVLLQTEEHQLKTSVLQAGRFQQMVSGQL